MSYLRLKKKVSKKVSLLFVLITISILGINFTDLQAVEHHIKDFLDKSIYRLNSNELKILETKYNISDNYIKELKTIGFKKIQVDDIINLKKFNTSIKFIKEMKKIGSFHLAIDEIAIMSKYGITAEYINIIREQGSERLSLDEIIVIAKNSIKPYLIKELKNIGYQNVETWIVKKIIKNKIPVKYLKTVFNATNKSKIEIIKILIKKGYIDKTSDFDYNKAIEDNKIIVLKLDQAVNIWKTGFNLDDVNEISK